MTREQFLEELPKLAEGYKPAPETINKISNLSLVMFIGPTGVGKTTLIKQSGFNYVPSDNTRLPRPGEIEGVDFYFRQDYDQVVEDIKLGRFLQIAIDGSGDLKATRAAAYPDSGTIAMAIMWNVITQFRNLGFKKTISAFIVPPDFEEWQRRIAKQDLSKDQLQKRLAEAKKSFSFGLTDPQVHLILNDQIKLALDQIKGLAEGRVDIGREASARRDAQNILDRID
ncbi:MAG TPA: hypothetical protein VHL10_08570 [Nitrososphaera sp.]|nr:hypothetical protein [Nitrososphaera sp.]